MELNNWCTSCSCSRNIDASARNGYDRVTSFDAWAIETSRSSIPRLRSLWRKIMKEKKKIFHCSPTGGRVHFSYDPYAYSQNFDQGWMWSDPDNISRSFSARFAVPTRIFEDSALVG